MQEALSKTCQLYPEVRLMGVCLMIQKYTEKGKSKRLGRKNEVYFEHFERTVGKGQTCASSSYDGKLGKYNSNFDRIPETIIATFCHEVSAK